MALAAVFIEHVAQIAQPRAQRHHPRLTQRVDGRVRHLAEGLAEIMVQTAMLARQHGKRRVVAHRAHGFLRVFHHRMQDDFQLFQRGANRHLTTAQRLALIRHRLRRVGLDDLIDLGDRLGPFAEGLTGGQHVLHLIVGVEARGIEIDADALARTHAALLDNFAFVDLDHAGFRADDEHAALGDRIAQRTQAVAVQTGDDPFAVRRRNRRRAVPRLHHRVAIQEQIAMRLRHRGVGPDAGRDHQRLGHRGVATGADEHFEDVVERGGVRPTGLHDRLDVFHVGIERRIGQPGFVAAHPVDVARDRVDLTVMRQHAEGLGQLPGGEGVGGIALMIDRKARHEAGVEQVGIEIRQALGQEHALIDQRPAGQRAQIQHRNLRGDRLVLDAPTDDIQIALEIRFGRAARVPDHDLLDFRPRRIGLLADARDVDRHLTPAIDGIAHAQDFALDDLTAALLCAEIGLRQKHLSDGDRAGMQQMTAALDGIGEEILRDFDVNARAVAGLAIGIDRTAMPDGLERVDTGFHHVAAGLAVQGGDEADAAILVLHRRRVGVREAFGILLPGGHEFRAGFTRHAQTLVFTQHRRLPSRQPQHRRGDAAELSCFRTSSHAHAVRSGASAPRRGTRAGSTPAQPG